MSTLSPSHAGKRSVAVWLATVAQVTRAKFFLSLVSSVLVGAALAWYDGSFNGWYLIWTVLGIVCANGGLNMLNDYFDHLSGNDEANQQLTPFSGGSRTIQEGVLPARQVLFWGLMFTLASVVIGLYLALARGLWVLWLGIIGIFITVFTSAPPFKLNYRGHGLGELATFLGSGPLIVLGSYYVQVQELTVAALLTSVAVGFLGAALIWINEFPDYEADKAAGKNTLVVLLGRRRAAWGYAVLVAGVYAAIVIGVAAGLVPAALLLVFLSVPLAYKGIRGALRFHDDIPKLVPSSAATVQLYLASALLLCVGCAIAKFF